MKPILAKNLLALLGLVIIAACGTLDESGPYKGDKFLYDADAAFIAAHDTVETFLKWEYANRAIVPKEVTAAADKLRDEYPKLHASFYLMRDAYVANPSGENKVNLQNVLSLLRLATTEALRYTTATPTPK